MRCWLRTTSWKPSVVSSAGEPDADHRPARAQQLEPERARGLRADRVEHQVGLAASGLLGRAVDGVRAERRRARAPRVLRLDAPRRAGCPSSSAACSVTRPIVPAPSTTARSTPGRRRAATACTPLASGSISAPTREDTPSGSTPRVGRAARVTKSANAPGDVHADQHAVAAEVARARRGTAGSRRSRSAD